MRLSIFLLSLSVIGLMGVLPTHTTFGFLGSRFLVMALPPDCTLGVHRGLRALAGALFLLLFVPPRCVFLRRPLLGKGMPIRGGNPCFLRSSSRCRTLIYTSSGSSRCFS